MTHRRGKTPKKPTIYLIAEDQTGEIVFKEIIRKRGIDARIESLGRQEGVSTLAAHVEENIKTALERRQNNDCIIVLHDTDSSVQTNRKDYEDIARICEKYADTVTRLEAVDEIESWLLADDAFCAWLGKKPKASDHIRQPSKVVEHLIYDKFKQRMWIGREKPKILADHFSATGDQPGRSKSMKEAMDSFLQLPCAEIR